MTMAHLETAKDSAKGPSEQKRVTVFLLPGEESRADALGSTLEAMHRGEFGRPQVISRAFDALARELGVENLAHPVPSVNPPPLTANVGN